MAARKTPSPVGISAISRFYRQYLSNIRRIDTLTAGYLMGRTVRRSPSAVTGGRHALMRRVVKNR